MGKTKRYVKATASGNNLYLTYKEWKRARERYVKLHTKALKTGKKVYVM